MKQRLYKSRTEKKLAGVAGGFANYLDLDPTIVRIVFILLTLLHGIGALLYLICMIIVPKEPLKKNGKEGNGMYDPENSVRSNQPVSTVEKEELNNRSTISGYVLLAIGILFS